MCWLGYWLLSRVYLEGAVEVEQEEDRREQAVGGEEDGENGVN